MPTKFNKKPTLKATALFNFPKKAGLPGGFPTDPTATSMTITSFVGAVKNRS
ncbi:hypothetical protein [Mucilaginibacter terrigena]|uniref:hypothetical protein n=1 Tax=Mucilaginibacter terrigena TaxID=2492395 RepID=UPI001396AEC5|nr:hypothetical protein [Mucilaginibacter terrigena]